MLGGAAAAALPAVAAVAPDYLVTAYKGAAVEDAIGPTVAYTMESDFVTYVITTIYSGPRMMVELDFAESLDRLTPDFEAGGLAHKMELPHLTGLEIGDKIAIYFPPSLLMPRRGSTPRDQPRPRSSEDRAAAF